MKISFILFEKKQKRWFIEKIDLIAEDQQLKELVLKELFQTWSNRLLSTKMLVLIFQKQLICQRYKKAFQILLQSKQFWKKSITYLSILMFWILFFCKLKKKKNGKNLFLKLYLNFFFFFKIR